MELRPGATIDRYTLELRLGAGGQGEVWRASDRLHPGRAVALKLVPLSMADGGRAERVRREARLLSRLRHPALPACHALFEDLEQNLLVIALEFVEGTTLHDAAPRLVEGQRVAVMRQLAAALAHLHERGVVHRDLKPDNVILEPGFADDPRRPGAVRLIDLGISVEQGNVGGLTQIGHIVGTAPYLAPEILDPTGFPADDAAPAVDVFALGVLGWGLTQGGHPTGLPEGSSMTDYALAYRHADQLPSWPAPGRGDRLEPVLRRCLAVRARERFGSGADALASLDRALGDGPRVSDPTPPPPPYTPPPYTPAPPAYAPPSHAPPAYAPPSHARPHHAAPAAAPGLAPTAPGLAGTVPGLAGAVAGVAPTAPGLASTAPGLAGTAPGVADTAPGGAPAYTVLDAPPVRPSWTGAPPTVHATPLPASLHEPSRPSVPSPAPRYPSGPVHAPGYPSGPPAAAGPAYLSGPSYAATPLPDPPRPAAPAPAPVVGFTPRRSRRRVSAAPTPAPALTPLPAAPLAVASAAPSAPLVAPAAGGEPLAPRRPSLLRYLAAFLLLLLGGAAAFVLTIVIFVLVHLGR